MDPSTFVHKEPLQIIDNRDLINTPFMMTQYYINSCIEDITIVDRNNLPYVSPAHSGGFSGGNIFTVRRIYNFHSNLCMTTTCNNIKRYIDAYQNKNILLNIVYQAILDTLGPTSRANSATVCVEYNFTYAELKSRGNLYCPDLDIVLSIDKYKTELVHPYSHEGKALNEYHNFVDNRKVSGVFVEVVDNESTISSRFMYVAKQVIEIPVHKDLQRPSGVYYTRAVNDRLNQTHLHPEFIDFSEAEDKIGLYKTKEDATSGGNPELLVKQEYAAYEQNLENMRQTNAELKEKIRRSELEREEQLSASKHEREVQIAELQSQLETSKQSNALLAEQLKARSTVRADYYEDRSISRKDSSEWLKIAALGITSGLGLAAVIYKATR